MRFPSATISAWVLAATAGTGMSLMTPSNKASLAFVSSRSAPFLSRTTDKSSATDSAYGTHQPGCTCVICTAHAAVLFHHTFCSCPVCTGRTTSTSLYAVDNVDTSSSQATFENQAKDSVKNDVQKTDYQ